MDEVLKHVIAAVMPIVVCVAIILRRRKRRVDVVEVRSGLPRARMVNAFAPTVRGALAPIDEHHVMVMNETPYIGDPNVDYHRDGDALAQALEAVGSDIDRLANNRSMMTDAEFTQSRGVLLRRITILIGEVDLFEARGRRPGDAIRFHDLNVRLMLIRLQAIWHRPSWACDVPMPGPPMKRLD